MSLAMLPIAARADEPRMAPPTFRDLCEIHMVTEGAHHNHAYPTCRTWSRDGRQVFAESRGPGPDGDPNRGEIHLVAIDVETSLQRHLATIPPIPGYDHATAYYVFDYAPAANCIVYQDQAGKHLHLLNLDTGKSGVVYHEPEGTIREPPTIATDGTRIAWWATFPSIENRFFDNYVTVIFALDVDLVTCRTVGEPRIIDVYPRRKGKTWTREKPRDGVHINHPQINPRDKDHICYSHEMLGAEPDGSVAMSRLWHVRVDESRKEPLIRQPAGLHFTHEVIAPDGKSLIFPYMFGVGQVFFDTGEARSIYYNRDCCPGHLTVSPDQKWITGDTWGDWIDPQGRRVQSIMMFDVATRKCAHLCWIPRAAGHPGHPHPSFSPDGTRIAFTMLDDQGVCQVAYIDVRDVQRRWDEVAQGKGGLAAPAWIEGVERRGQSRPHD
jgi:hypothetical protein